MSHGRPRRGSRGTGVTTELEAPPSRPRVPGPVRHQGPELMLAQLVEALKNQRLRRGVKWEVSRLADRQPGSRLAGPSSRRAWSSAPLPVPAASRRCGSGVADGVTGAGAVLSWVRGEHTPSAHPPAPALPGSVRLLGRSHPRAEPLGEGHGRCSHRGRCPCSLSTRAPRPPLL